MAIRKGNGWFFVFGFEKSERANITPTELEALQLLASSLLGLADGQLNTNVQDGRLHEICHDH